MGESGASGLKPARDSQRSAARAAVRESLCGGPSVKDVEGITSESEDLGWTRLNLNQ